MRVCEEVLAQQQILGGIAGEGKLSEQHEIGPGLASLIDARTDPHRVGSDVAHRGIHLAESQPHNVSLAGIFDSQGEDVVLSRDGSGRVWCETAMAGSYVLEGG